MLLLRGFMKIPGWVLPEVRTISAKLFKCFQRHCFYHLAWIVTCHGKNLDQKLSEDVCAVLEALYEGGCEGQLLGAERCTNTSRETWLLGQFSVASAPVDVSISRNSTVLGGMKVSLST